VGGPAECGAGQEIERQQWCHPATENRTRLASLLKSMRTRLCNASYYNGWR